MTFRISEYPAYFPPTVLLPGAALPLSIGQGSFGLGSPVSGTMTALRLLTALPARFCLYSRYWYGLPLFRFALASFPSEQGKSPVHLYPALSVGGFLPPEALSPHTFPYDPLYICPALRPRPRCPRSLNARPRPLPPIEK